MLYTRRSRDVFTSAQRSGSLLNERLYILSTSRNFRRPASAYRDVEVVVGKSWVAIETSDACLIGRLQKKSTKPIVIDLEIAME